MLIPPRNPTFSAASCAQEIQALGEQCESIVVRSGKQYLLKFSTPNIPKPNCSIFFGKNALRARGESNRVPPGSDPPTSRGPNHYVNPAPESRLLSGFLCTGNTRPGRAVRVNCHPSRKTRLLKMIDAQYPKTYFVRSFSRKNTLRSFLFNVENSISEQ